MSNQNGGGYSIKENQSLVPVKKLKTKKTVSIQNMILKELLKKETIAVEKEVISAQTGESTRITETITKPSLLFILDSIKEMAYNPDFRIKGVGIKLLIDFLSKTENIIYHPSVIAKLNIDKLNMDPKEKEIFIALLQKANQIKNQIE